MAKYEGAEKEFHEFKRTWLESILDPLEGSERAPTPLAFLAKP